MPTQKPYGRTPQPKFAIKGDAGNGNVTPSKRSNNIRPRDATKDPSDERFIGLGSVNPVRR